MVGIHCHDVLVLRHRPVIAPQRTVRQVYRIVAAQPLEIVADRVVQEKRRRRGIDLLQRHRERCCARVLLAGRLV